MKTFRTTFPYVCETVLPGNIEALLEERAFDGLNDTMRNGQGWSRVATDTRLLEVDDKYLLRYLSSKRKPDALAVSRLLDERVAQANENGREVTPDLLEELRVQAENEVVKYAPIASHAVYLLLWPAQKLLIASGGTAAKCEDALSYLRRTIDSLAAVPWGDVSVISNAVTKHMTVGFYQLPENLIISPFGKTLYTGDDSSLKIVLDGVQNNTEEAKNILSDMTARSVEMSLIRRPDNGQIEYLASFNLQMPLSGNIHFKSFDYDDDVEREDLAQALIAEMHLVSVYTHEIIASLNEFAGIVKKEEFIQQE